MGRPRGGKANKRPTPQGTKSSEDADAASGDEDAVMPAYKRRGRPQKHLKADDTDEEEEGQDSGKVEPMGDSDGDKPAVPGKGSAENGGKKRTRRRQPSKRGSDPAAEEKDGAGKQSGFRHHGSRRKSTPRRAAEAGVECK
jgi:hypothetical protein